MIYFGIALIIFLIDQGVKYLVATRMELYEQIPVIGNFFLITSHRNRGAAFGILEGQRWLFIVITIVVVIGIVWYLRKTVKAGQKLLPVALSLVLGEQSVTFWIELFQGKWLILRNLILEAIRSPFLMWQIRQLSSV